MRPIDPKRPWISDPDDLPSRLDWFRSLLDPVGETSRLHFTRVWTFLFFTRFVFFFVPPLIVLIFGVSGAEDPGSAGLPPWAFPLVVVVTCLMSYVLHRRRLTNARKSALLAAIVLIPLIFGFLGFMAGAGQGTKDYGVAVEVKQLRAQGVSTRQMAIDFDRRNVFATLSKDVVLRFVRQEMAEGREGDVAVDAAYRSAANPTAVSELLSEEGIELTAERRGKLDRSLQRRINSRSSFFGGFDGFLSESDRRSINGYEQSVANSWRGHLPDIDLSQESERGHAFKTGLQTSIVFWAIPSALVMLWSLLWVGRLPNRGATA
ncbi:MAG: hypothetical protein AAF950_10270 [Pseudomonadota bacterium]